MKRTLFFSAATLALAAAQTYAGVFTANFDDCLTAPCAPPVGSAVYGSTVIEPTGGVGDTGVLKLTKAINSQEGSFVIEDLDMGAPVNGFDLRFKARVGGGTATPADGFSFAWGAGLPNAGWSEEGTGTGLSVAFDIYDNAGGEAPAIDIKWGGVNNVLRHTNVPISFIRTGTEFVDVQIRLDTDGSLDVVYNGTPVYTDVLLRGFQPTGASRFGFGGRTGGLNENQWIDDLQLTTTTGTLGPRFLREPADVTVREGGSLTLRSQINDPTLVFPGTYQWSRRGPGETTFTPIAGANDTNYTAGPLTLADSGAQYFLQAETVEGPRFTRTATVNVVTITLPAADVTYNFEDGQAPLGTAVHGDAEVAFDAGENGLGGVRLTEAANSQAGTFIINDLNGGQAVDSISVNFKARVGGGTVPPADGFSFNWANNLPDGVITGGEEGGGDGLTVTFDVFDSGGGEAPAVDVKFAGTNIASTKVPLDLLETGDAFADVIIQLLADGRVNVVYNDIVLHNGVVIPGWSALGNARFGFAARTGGLNAAHHIDEIGISTTLFAGSLSLTRQPSDTAILVGGTATFSVEVNDPANATFQWQRQSAGETVFTDIPGATAASYTTPATSASDHGARYRVVAAGPLNTITSEEVTLTVVNVARPTSPEVAFDFNDCLVEPCTAPMGTTTYGTARVTSTGGTAGTGVMRVAEALNDQNGSWIIEDFMGGQAVSGFTLAFNAYVDDGTATPADGYSVSWGTDIPSGLLNPAEEGAGTGLIVSFDLWNSSAAGQPAEAPAIDIKWRGQTVVHKLVPTAMIETGSGTFKEVLVQLEPDGTVDVVVGGELIHNDVVLPNFTPIAGARFAFAARTGGANNNYFFDDVAIDAVLYTGPIAFSTEPSDEVVLEGSTATFSATVNDPVRAALQWQARAPGASAFTNIAGATSGSYTTRPLTLADSGTELQLIATATSNTVTSQVARLTVITISQPTPTAAFNFDDCVAPPCAPPAGTALFVGSTTAGGGFIDATGGVGGSGVLKLTTAVNGQQNAFIVNDLNPGQTVHGFTASFQARVGGGTTPPADGWSFVWGNDIADGPFGEDGSGTNLVVTFDIFDNAGGEAPAIDITYRGEIIASTKVPLSFLRTGDAFVPVLIRVENDGTLDVVYNNEVVYHNLQLPGFNGMTGGRFGWGGRTGGLNENQWIDDIQIATDLTAAPRLTVSRNGNNVTVSWAGGELQSAPTINGPWTTETGATSPVTFNNTTGMRFFRTVNP